jgi:hypothetical protein
MKRGERLKIGDTELLIYGTIRGLVSEREKVRKIVESFSPNTILLGISPEQWEGLKKYVKKPFKIEPNDYEIIYALKLEKFGEVGLPVQTYLEILSISKKYNLSIVPIDMDDELYSNLFTKKIDILKLIRFDMRKRKLYKMNFEASTPEEFVILWDKEVNKIREYREIEEEREKFMSDKIIEIAKNVNGKRVMAIVEFERFEGIIKRINSNS